MPKELKAEPSRTVVVKSAKKEQKPEWDNRLINITTPKKFEDHRPNSAIKDKIKSSRKEPKSTLRN